MFRRRRPKIFCIGSNKTGTTSLGTALELLGFRLGDQHQAERLIDAWARRDWRPIINYCRTAEAFQDIPFSLAHAYAVLDYAYPGSKFILTVRGSADEWFESLMRFHTRLIGAGRLPTAADLKGCPYNLPGWLWRAHAFSLGVDEHSPYDRRRCMRKYEEHIAAVEDFFRYRPNDLLVLNVASAGAMEALGCFVGRDPQGRSMPHLNSSLSELPRPVLACA